MVYIVFDLNNLSCIGSGVQAKDRPVLSLEGAQQEQDSNSQTESNIWS
jgi:hypothetical protein